MRNLAVSAWPVLAVLALSAACGGPGPVPFEDEIATARTAKDEVFRTSPDSPIPATRRAELLPLVYFPPDPAYRVPAVLEPVDVRRSGLTMPTSTGQLRSMVRVGVLQFTLKGQSLALGAFMEATAPNMDRLFVPFTDLTTGTETYAGGRYLEFDRTATGVYVIDFNRAFNPYCAYNADYDCPFPPPENRLAIPIRAGEKTPGRDAGVL